LLIEIQRAMMAGAQKIIVCLDHTKFGRRSVTLLSTLEPIDTVVTDSAAPPDLVESIRAAGVEVVVAPPSEPSERIR
jgi:DeoR/GlpR family transcriptional regulator of sugar metabolism